MKSLVLVTLMIMMGAPVVAQEKPKTTTTQFKTTAICGSCKNRIEKKLNYSKGVIYSELNLETKIVTVKYKTKLLDEKSVRELVTSLGYKAGEMERDTVAFKALPKCCREEGFCAEDE